jgi:K+-sensing histidine kinase KdpD
MGMPGTGAPLDVAEIDSALLAALIESPTAREGAAAILDAIAPAFAEDLTADPVSMALAARDSDGMSLHVLAECGAPRAWPEVLEPRFAVSAQSGVDPVTEAFVLPLRSSGRVIGALLFDGSANAALLRDPAADRLLATVAATLDTLVKRADGVVQRRAVALRSVESVLEGMAHQMANPLTGASAIAQLLVEEITDEGQRAAVTQIRQELNRAFVVLQDLLSFRRVGPHAGVLDLNTVAEEITRFRGYAIREQGITLHVEPMSMSAPVRVDARRLEQALLLALRFAELQSRGSVNRSVAVRVLERPNAELEIEVTDSGPGNVPELSSSRYDLPFNEADAASAVANQRPDLGLVDSILRGAGGSLQVRGSKAAGTTLSLVLPRAAAAGSTPTRSK